VVGRPFDPKLDYVANAGRERIQNLFDVNLDHFAEASAWERSMLPNYARTAGDIEESDAVSAFLCSKYFSQFR